MFFELSHRAMLVRSHTHHVSISCRQEIDMESERHLCSVMSAYKHEVDRRPFTLPVQGQSERLVLIPALYVFSDSDNTSLFQCIFRRDMFCICVW